MNIVDEIKNSYKNSDVLIKLIYINLAIFLSVHILEIIITIFNISPDREISIIYWFAVPSSIEALAKVPWSIFTYMFLHENFIHILFNMLWLFWFGKIFLIYLSEKQLLGIYIFGGLSGAVLYIISYNIFPGFEQQYLSSVALGASASVMAVIVAISAYAPNYTLNLMFIGNVKIKYIALSAFVFTSLLDFSVNSGGKIAHIGGAILGYYFIVSLKKGKDFTKGINRFFDKIIRYFDKKPKITYKNVRKMTDEEYNQDKAKQQEVIDKILDKVAKSGYSSLSQKEKDILFRASDK
ncbi:MAG: rhomboid family intramembrane serine protease [Bacteroidetes bacterium]|jgi:membrane associated rhomboid family serine protease|nr:rhomboid family intramembrane serine protease [Bacteroidota bacterium]MBT6687804.1 rhomboid family intramembrane serine protease [Bacteroidota bacterium]MBT7143473.1 rhomboid family intramembrane serine protease [Bacteroidota bacterium]MBT7493139.1 rhomboid family intramembrane serine protease [Bacteroidota bacterium]